jgi:tRNA-modifying protein YgfZ
MSAELIPNRSLIRVTGADRHSFLQGLITNSLNAEGLTWAALLSPQGKYLADFFLFSEGDHILLDVQSSLADGLMKRLSMYRLRADVALQTDPRQPRRGLTDAPAGAFTDPRHTALGWRSYPAPNTGADSDSSAADDTAPGSTDWDAIRVEHCIPETGIELRPNETYILEAGFERLNGVDFRKGCYVGQEITARMKHKTELRKGLITVEITGPAPAPGTPVMVEGRAIGTLFTSAGNRAIAGLRFDKAHGHITAGDAVLRLP